MQCSMDAVQHRCSAAQCSAMQHTAPQDGQHGLDNEWLLKRVHCQEERPLKRAKNGGSTMNRQTGDATTKVILKWIACEHSQDYLSDDEPGQLFNISEDGSHNLQRPLTTINKNLQR